MRMTKEQEAQVWAAVEALAEAGVLVETSNGGMHLMVRDPDDITTIIADFWPTAGRYRLRDVGGKSVQGGVPELLVALGVRRST